MQRASLRQTVLQNFDSTKEQKHRDSRYEKISPEELFDLLNAVSGRYRAEATAVLRLLASKAWYIHYTAHEGGSDPNAPLHILVMAPTGIHLNCKQNADDTLYIYQITYG